VHVAEDSHDKLPVMEPMERSMLGMAADGGGSRLTCRLKPTFGPASCATRLMTSELGSLECAGREHRRLWSSAFAQIFSRQLAWRRASS
jgi:hypothetical protein